MPQDYFFSNTASAGQATTDLRLRQGRVVRSYLEKLVTQVHGISAAVVCAHDGFEIAALASEAELVSKLSAMSCALYGVSMAMLHESGLRACRSVTIEANLGHIVMLPILWGIEPWLLTVVTPEPVLIGAILSVCRQHIDTLIQELAKLS